MRASESIDIDLNRIRFAIGLALCASLCSLFLIEGVSNAQAACTNEAIRQAQTSEALPDGTTYLPSCMALEMASPPKKLQQPAFSPSFSPDGSRILFRAQAALADTPGQQVFAGDYYVGTRGSSGWTTASTSPPASMRISTGTNTEGGPYAFSPDLDRWVFLGATQAQGMAGVAQLFQSGLGGSVSPLSPILIPSNQSGDGFIVVNIKEAESSGTAADLSATVFHPKLPTTSYLPGDPIVPSGGELSGDQDEYVAFLDEAGQPSLELLARDKSGAVYGGRCGVHFGGGMGAPHSGLDQGAISPDGSRIYFSTRPAQAEGPACSLANPLRIFKRTATPAGPEVEALLPGGLADWSQPGDDLYQGASADGTKVYFTSPRKLTSSDQDTSAEECGAKVGESVGCDLYLYDSAKPPAERLTQVSAGENVPAKHEAGKGADVLSSITAISSDGSHVYFPAQGALTTDPNPEGDTAQAGEPNLYLYQRDSAHPSGELSFVGTLATDDGQRNAEGLWGSEQTSLTTAYAVPRLGPGEEDGADGHILAFASKASLTADDSDGGKSDVFRYDSAAGTLQRISKASAEGSEVPASNVATTGRWASEDGNTIAFSTAEPLVAEDSDQAPSPYLWKDGQLSWLPSAEESLGGAAAVVSPSGAEVAIPTTLALLPQDGDSASDVYVARTDGGFPNPSPPIACDPLSEGSCQGPVVAPPAGRGTATSSFVGPGNPQLPAKCRKGLVRKRARCVKPRKKQSQARKKQASHKRGGKK